MKHLALLLVASLAACVTTTTPRPATLTRRPLVRGEEFRVVASTASTDGDAYDATLLFERANQAVRDQHCEQALALYDRLIHDFPDNLRVAPAQYNRGLCLDRLGRLPEANEALRSAAQTPRDPELSHDAWFRVAAIGERGEHPAWVVEATDALLARPNLPIADRVEALARRAAAQLALNSRDEAEHTAQSAVTLAPTPEAVSALTDDTYAAQARVVLAEATRLRSAEVVYRIEDPGAEEAITRKVQLLTHAHVLFNDAIRVGNPHWAAAAGFRIGEMYADLYHAIVDAPAPADWGAPAREVYRRRTSERLRPLLQGALRSWEATLAMARRNGVVDNEWVRRADQALDNLRALILGEAPAPTRPRPPPAPSASPSTVRPAA